MRRPWSTYEERRLRELAGRGLTYAQIAAKLDRSPAATAIRANQMGIKRFGCPPEKRDLYRSYIRRGFKAHEARRLVDMEALA